MSARAARRQSALLWITPPAFAISIALWSQDHRLTEDPRMTAANARTCAKNRGEDLPMGTAEIAGTISAPDGSAGPSDVEISLAREDWLAEHNPGAWRCCEGCSFA